MVSKRTYANGLALFFIKTKRALLKNAYLLRQVLKVERRFNWWNDIQITEAYRALQAKKVISSSKNGNYEYEMRMLIVLWASVRTPEHINNFIKKLFITWLKQYNCISSVLMALFTWRKCAIFVFSYSDPVRFIVKSWNHKSEKLAKQLCANVTYTQPKNFKRMLQDFVLDSSLYIAQKDRFAYFLGLNK